MTKSTNTTIVITTTAITYDVSEICHDNASKFV